MGDEEADFEPSKKRWARARSLLSRLSAWERILLGVLVILVLVGSAPIIYVWSAKRKAAHLRDEVFRLRGSHKVEDWARLLDLKQAPIAKRFPDGVSWLFAASADKVEAYATSVRGPAEDVLREAVLGDSSCTLRALACDNQAVAEWVVGHLVADFFELRPKGRQPRYSEAYRRLVEGCLAGDADVLKFVLSPTPGRIADALRSDLLGEVFRRDEARGYPLIKEFLVRHLDAIPVKSEIRYYVATLAKTFVEHLRDEDLPLAERLAQGMIRASVPYPEARAVIKECLKRAGPKGARLLEEGLASLGAATRGIAIQEAANQRLLSPHHLWAKALEESDHRCRIIAARVLGYEKARETADALAKLLGDPMMEVRLQAAWSLAAMGDPRGREALKQLESNNSTLCLDLLAIYAPPYPGYDDGLLGRLPPRPVGAIAQGILAHVDSGGTIPLTISPWPGSGQPLEEKPADFY
jgi:hypothetical protein